MHEMSITQGIIELCLEHAGGRRIRSLIVEIGELSSAVPEAIEFCFEACSRETLLEGAQLSIIRIPGNRALPGMPPGNAALGAVRLMPALRQQPGNHYDGRGVTRAGD